MQILIKKDSFFVYLILTISNYCGFYKNNFFFYVANRIFEENKKNIKDLFSFFRKLALYHDLISILKVKGGRKTRIISEKKRDKSNSYNFESFAYFNG